MKPINELLRKYIEQSNYTIYSISHASKINRSTLQLALSGDRPISKENLKKLLPFLQLTPKEYKELIHSFLIAQLGNITYQKDMYLWELLKTPVNHSFSIVPTEPVNTYDSQLITGSHHIINWICGLISYEIECNEKPYIYSLSHFQNVFFKDLYEQLQNVSSQVIDIKHVVPFIKTVDSDSPASLFNLQILSSLLPFVFAGQVNCSFYYYYEKNNLAHIYGIPFPYYIVTNHNVILLSLDYQKALVLPEMCVNEYKIHMTNILTFAKPLLSSEERISPVVYSEIEFLLDEDAVTFLYQTDKTHCKTCTLKEHGVIESVRDFFRDLPLLQSVLTN